MTDGQFFAIIGSVLGGVGTLLVTLGGPLWKLSASLSRHDTQIAIHEVEIDKLRDAKERHSGLIQRLVVKTHLGGDEQP